MKRANLIQTVFSVAILMTAISFLPVSTIKTVTETFYYILWGLLLLLLFIYNRKIWVNNTLAGMLLAYVGCVIATRIAIQIGDYPSGSSIGCAKYLLYSIAFYFVGYNFTISVEDAFKRLLRAFMIGVFLVALIVLLRRGLESGKNQLGQLLGVSAILGFFILPRNTERRQHRVFYIMSGIISVAALLAIRSRTPVIGIAVVTTAHLLANGKKDGRAKAIRTILILFAMLGVIFAVEMGVLDSLFSGFSPELGRDITLSEALGNRESMDVVLSGRLTHYSIAWQDFIEHPLFGVGPWAYIDNFVMHTLRAGGLWFAFCLFPAAYGTMFFTTTRFRKTLMTENAPEITKMFYEALRDMTLFYFVESMGEGYPPIGPGASAFFLWLLLGIGSQQLVAAQKEPRELNRGSDTI